MCRNVHYGDRKHHFQSPVWVYLSVYMAQLQRFSLWHLFIYWLTVWQKNSFYECGKRKQFFKLIAVNIVSGISFQNVLLLHSKNYFKNCCTNSIKLCKHPLRSNCILVNFQFILTYHYTGWQPWVAVPLNKLSILRTCH